MKNQTIIEVAENCRKNAIHPGESSDFARGVRDVIKELSRAAQEQAPGIAERLSDIAESCR